MRATIWGTATQIGALVANRSLSGAVTAAHSYDNLETELPPDGLTIDLDHSGDLHRPSERTGWPVTWRQTDLLARAAAQLDSRDSRAERIIDCRATAPGAAAECETASPRQPVQPGGLWLRSAGVPLDVAKHR